MDFRRLLKIQIRIPGDKKRSGKSLTQSILDACRKESILGATVVRCDFGFGEHEYKQHALRSLTDLPQLIEIIDEAEEILQKRQHRCRMQPEGMGAERVDVSRKHVPGGRCGRPGKRHSPLLG